MRSSPFQSGDHADFGDSHLKSEINRIGTDKRITEETEVGSASGCSANTTYAVPLAKRTDP